MQPLAGCRYAACCSCALCCGPTTCLNPAALLQEGLERATEKTAALECQLYEARRAPAEEARTSELLAAQVKSCLF